MDHKNSAAGAAPRENKMGVMPVGKLLANMAIPMMISMLFQAFYNVVDSYFVGKISQDAFNAVSLAFPLQMLMISLGGGTGVGMNALLSRSLGEKRQEAADRAANTGIFLFLCSAALFTVIGLTVSRPFFLAQTRNMAIVDYGTAYTMICLGGSVGIFGQFCMERLLQSTGRTNLSMATQIVGAGINIIMDPILIFGWFGFPRMEVAGAAVATVLGQIVAALLALYFNLKFNPDIHIRLRHIRWHGPTARDIYRVGVPSIIMQSIGSVMTFTMNQILIGFTEAATAVFGAYFKLQSFVFMPIFGLNNGMVPIVSYNYGAARMDRVKKAIRLTVIVSVSIMTAGMLLFELLPGTLLGIFTPSEEMLAIGRTALRIIGVHFPIAGFCIIAGSVFQAIGNPVHSLINSVCRQLVVLLPAAWLLAQTGRLELVWLAFPIAELMSLLLSTIFLRKTLRAADERLARPQE
ncbi:MAG: MATE family efflux transporter [Ruminococcaceae bacterium]|nr:MATE family efflux transporter [Oscillospiraceae bacterium]